MMRGDVHALGQRIARSHGMTFAELVSSRLTEHVRVRHAWRALVATTLGYGYPSGISLSELARVLGCDRDSVRHSLRGYRARGGEAAA